MQLAKGGSKSVKESLAENPSIDEPVQIVLANGPTSVQKSLASNPAICVGVQQHLVENGCIDVKISLYENEFVKKNVKSKIVSTLGKSDLERANIGLKVSMDQRKEAEKEYYDAMEKHSNYTMKMGSWLYSESTAEKLASDEKTKRLILRHISEIEDTNSRIIRFLAEVLSLEP